MKALLSLALLILSVTFALAQAATTAKCPAITIIGPAGVEMPWDAMTFQVSLTGEVPKRLAYKWDVVGGAIMGGQGTPELKARYINVSKFLATVTVVGLPSGCPTTAFEPLSMTGPEPGPVHLGTINNSTYTIDEALLEKIREALTSNDGSQLYVWLYTGSSSEGRTSSLKSRLLRQLSTTKIDSSRITLQVSSERARGAIFWLVGPGSDSPAP